MRKTIKGRKSISEREEISQEDEDDIVDGANVIDPEPIKAITPISSLNLIAQQESPAEGLETALDEMMSPAHTALGKRYIGVMEDKVPTHRIVEKLSEEDLKKQEDFHLKNEKAEKERLAKEERDRIAAGGKAREDEVTSSVSMDIDHSPADKSKKWITLEEERGANGSILYRIPGAPKDDLPVVSRFKTEAGLEFEIIKGLPGGTETKIENEWTHDGKPVTERLVLNDEGKIIDYEINPENAISKCSREWLSKSGFQEFKAKQEVKTQVAQDIANSLASNAVHADSTGITPSATPGLNHDKGVDGRDER